MFRCPKCKHEGMNVDCRPSVRTEFDGDGNVVGHEFQNGPGCYDTDDTAFCNQCSFEGVPSDFEYENKNWGPGVFISEKEEEPISSEVREARQMTCSHSIVRGAAISITPSEWRTCPDCGKRFIKPKREVTE